VVLYLKVENGYETLAHELFAILADTGYGKRKSAGYGAVRNLEFEPFRGFRSPSDANGFVSLSPFVPAAADPTRGFWHTRVKYGKLGEEFAAGLNPFKRPVLMLTEGSAFYDASPRKWYGRMVSGVSDTHREVVHYGYALPVPMRMPTLDGGTG
jgi:CRISPR type III-A-associated RAMP protein Csm4